MWGDTIFNLVWGGGHYFTPCLKVKFSVGGKLFFPFIKGKNTVLSFVFSWAAKRFELYFSMIHDPSCVLVHH